VLIIGTAQFECFHDSFHHLAASMREILLRIVLTLDLSAAEAGWRRDRIEPPAWTELRR
jgi:hypothetical protein